MTEHATHGTYDELIGAMVGEYRIETKLGQGGMGSVYGARHPLIGKRAAIKVIARELSVDRGAVDRFVLEAQSVNQIGHPNIVDVFAFGALPDGRSYFVMEWLPGQSLAARMREPVSLGETAAIVDAIARALEAAHEAGVIHRDLKPDNVFLTPVKDDAPRIKLLDFGLAKLSHSEMSAGLTRTGIVMGTPLYLSPEQARGARIDAATDVYSLGVILFELATGSAPFLADSAVEIMAKHISEPPPPPRERHPGLPAALETVIVAMLAKDPAARPALRTVRAALAPYRSSRDVPSLWEPAAAWLSSDPERRRVSASRTRTSVHGTAEHGHAAWVAAIVGGVAIVAGLAFAITRWLAGEPERAPAAVAAPDAGAAAVAVAAPDAAPVPAAAPDAGVVADAAAAPDAALPDKRRPKRDKRDRKDPEEKSVDVDAVHDPFATP